MQICLKLARALWRLELKIEEVNDMDLRKILRNIKRFLIEFLEMIYWYRVILVILGVAVLATLYVYFAFVYKPPPYTG